MDCKWIKNNKGNTKYICSVCGYETNYDNLHRVCNKPSMIKRASNLTKATVEHIKSGLHHCTKEQQMARYEICKSNKCGRFYNGICNHDDCGCFIKSSGKFMNKLSWASSKCPEGYWGPVENTDKDT